MSRKLRNLEEEPEQESEGWLTSYSDMITDLLAVFVLLFSFAMLSQGIPKAATSAMAVDMGGMASVMDGGASINGDQSAEAQEQESAIDKLIKALNYQIEEADLDSKINIEKQSNSVFIMRMADSVLFDTGKADLSIEANDVLHSLFIIMDGYLDYIDMVRIEGHTDNRPIKTAKFPSNWELSSARALNVLKVLLGTTTIGPDQVAYTGYGEYRPIAENDSPENMAKNRRVDFFIEMNPNFRGDGAGMQ